MPYEERERDDTLIEAEDAPTAAASPEALAQKDAPTEPRPSGPRSLAPPSGPVSGPISVGRQETGVQTLGGTGSGTTATSIAEPLETLRLQEIDRTRAFVRLAFGLSVVVSTLLVFVGGDPTAKAIMFAGMALIAGTTAWLGWLLRAERGYTVVRAVVCGYACIVGAFCAINFFGVFSPAVMVLPFGLFFFGAAQSFRATLSIYVVCAITLLGMSVAVSAGALPDHGLVTAASLDVRDRAVILAAEQLVLLATFLIARATRKATLDAIERHDRAVRGLAQREALLREARQDLERALKFGGLGRFTDTTLGSFRLGKILGRGGMGEVYEATHTTTHDAAAVKLLHTHVLADPDLLRRFMREAKMAQQLSSAHVVRVLEVGGLEAPVPYIAMERLRGEDLADHLRRHRQLAPRKAIALVRQLGRGLLAARKAGIVHRDLKPRNVFLAEEGVTKRAWKILDFGVSKLADGEGTQTKDLLIGTPQYMAPEQATGGEVTYRTDLYALGVIVYRALTGRPAFTGEQTAETLYQVVYQMPPRPSDVARLHPDFDHVLMIAMAKDAAARFDSGEELADALEAASRGALGDDLRARAKRLEAQHAWSS